MTFNSTQTKEWIKFWFLEYSKVILREYGFNVEDLLELGEVLENEIQKNISKKREVIDEIELSRQEFLKQCDISIDNYDIEIKKIRNNKSLQDKASSIFEKIEQSSFTKNIWKIKKGSAYYRYGSNSIIIDKNFFNKRKVKQCSR